VDGFKRAWSTAVLKAHGVKPEFTDSTNLTPASRAAFAKINLHFHDLRREAGSRWLDGGVPLHTIRDWLGHSNISQTSTYLSSTLDTSDEAMRRFEEHSKKLVIEVEKPTSGQPQSTVAIDEKPWETVEGRGTVIN
jgi:integrase